MEANNQAMRETLEFADRELRMATEDDRYGDDIVYLVGCMRTVAAACRAALAEPPRNCDVGTAEEQSERWWKFCEKHFILSRAKDNCAKCPIRGTNRHCELAWAQLPYESEVEK